MGPPGSGKGTQSKLLVDQLGYAYFSMGDALREYSKQDNPLAKRIKETIDGGVILPDNDVKELFFDSIAKIADKPGIIIDGFPRTLGQLGMLDELIAKYHVKNFKVVFLEVDKQKLLGRLTTRKTCPNCQAIYLPGTKEYISEICSVCGHKILIRPDDDPSVVGKRFDEYITKTAPVKDHYESLGQVIHIMGDQSDLAQESIKKVHQEILNKLGVE